MRFLLFVLIFSFFAQLSSAYAPVGEILQSAKTSKVIYEVKSAVSGPVVVQPPRQHPLPPPPQGSVEEAGTHNIHQNGDGIIIIEKDVQTDNTSRNTTAGHDVGKKIIVQDVPATQMITTDNTTRDTDLPKEGDKKTVESFDVISFGKDKIPENYRSITILGKAVIPREKAYKFLKLNADNPRLNCTLREIVDYYYDEAESEGVRADIALCQAVLETGTFSFGGIVRPFQNNFCGLGTVAKGVHGAHFSTARDGVRAHIQHLLAYCQKHVPKSKIIDPRYDIAHSIRLSRGLVTTWYGLTGTWAMDRFYAEKIMIRYVHMMETKD